MPSPDVVTCAIAIDVASRTNGCLQMLKGSHSLGLLEFDALPWGERHTTEQSVRSALESCDRVYCEQEPGDALFFSCLTVHCSESNTSAQPRWAYLCAFDHMQNAVRYVPEARPAPRWLDSTVLEYGKLQLADGGKLAWEGETEPSSQEDKVAEGQRTARL
jgi:ectoine hydroxylase-related dioxygenase (phytanoyl-CoA dioxygenase family)